MANVYVCKIISGKVFLFFSNVLVQVVILLSLTNVSSWRQCSIYALNNQNFLRENLSIAFDFQNKSVCKMVQKETGCKLA